MQFIFEQPEISSHWFKDPYLAVLSVENEDSLKDLISKLQEKNLKFTIFREPDINNQITAIAIEPSLETRRLTSCFPKMLREYQREHLIDKNTNIIKEREVDYV